jgi:hypothetical protein
MAAAAPPRRPHADSCASAAEWDAATRLPRPLPPHMLDGDGDLILTHESNKLLMRTPMPAVWRPVVDACEDHDLVALMRRWCQRRALRCALALEPHATWHPLLKALHYRDVDAAAFFVAVGCSAEQPGTSPPVTHDGYQALERALVAVSATALTSTLSSNLSFRSADRGALGAARSLLRGRRSRELAVRHLEWLRTLVDGGGGGGAGGGDGEASADELNLREHSRLWRKVRQASEGTRGAPRPLPDADRWGVP